ncbi:LytTR family DNA-binding domain-containing protein [Hymenobacter sp.]|jgi:DNA-binding LytR/AlgR family response regulator|uniref:LytR/AlgR family response regulator transcription factor n=1 Tax=Hymenobacter sp. TaxID=1898978 RepID=UPI002ED9A905
MSNPGALTCLVIDDDTMNRLTLEHYIGLTESLQLVASLNDGAQGLNFFRAGNKVDLLFLDVEMPNLSGLELLRVLTDPPEVILATSYEHFAVDAFALRVTDYLVKPFDYARFSQAVQRVLERRPTSMIQPVASPAPVSSDLFVKVNNRMVRLNFDEVLYIEALSDYVTIVTLRQKHIVYTTLKSFAARLSFDNFVRVHRSYILNMKHVESIEDNTARLAGGHQIPIGVSYQEAFFKNLNRF